MMKYCKDQFFTFTVGFFKFYYDFIIPKSLSPSSILS